MPKMTADEAIRTVARYKSDSPKGATCRPLQAAEAEIREAFAIADRARAELAREERHEANLRKRLDDKSEEDKWDLSARLKQSEYILTLLKRIIDGEGS